MKAPAFNGVDVNDQLDADQLDAEQTVEAEPAVTAARSRWWRRTGTAISRLAGWSFNAMSLVLLLAFVTAIPGIQLLSLGYLLHAGGRVAGGRSRVLDLPGAALAGQIGRAGLFLLLAYLPILLLTHWQSVAAIIQPDSGDAWRLRIAAIVLAIAATIQFGWGAGRGGRLRDYLWPAPKDWLRRGWRWSVWNDAADRLWQTVASMRLPRLGWLGLRAAAGTLIWLLPALFIMTATRQGRGGAVGLVAAIAAAVLGWGMAYLPTLQIHFAAEDRWRALFQWRTVRRHCFAAPWSWAAATAAGLIVLPTPLYLLKIEAVLQEVTWIPCVLFIALLLPARLLEGVALRRGRRLADAPPQHGRWGRRWATASRWLVRLLVMPAIVAVYLGLLLLSQYASWDGVETWVRQHAVLVPVPFEGL